MKSSALKEAVSAYIDLTAFSACDALSANEAVRIVKARYPRAHCVVATRLDTNGVPIPFSPLRFIWGIITAFIALAIVVFAFFTTGWLGFRFACFQAYLVMEWLNPSD